MSPEIEGVNLCHRLEGNSFLMPKWREFRASGRRMRGDKTIVSCYLTPGEILRMGVGGVGGG